MLCTVQFTLYGLISPLSQPGTMRAPRVTARRQNGPTSVTRSTTSFVKVARRSINSRTKPAYILLYCLKGVTRSRRLGKETSIQATWVAPTHHDQSVVLLPECDVLRAQHLDRLRHRAQLGHQLPGHYFLILDPPKNPTEICQLGEPVKAGLVGEAIETAREAPRELLPSTRLLKDDFGFDEDGNQTDWWLWWFFQPW